MLVQRLPASSGHSLVSGTWWPADTWEAWSAPEWSPPLPSPRVGLPWSSDWLCQWVVIFPQGPSTEGSGSWQESQLLTWLPYLLTWLTLEGPGAFWGV